MSPAQEHGGNVRLVFRPLQHLIPDCTSGEEAAEQIR
jgi:hypothetical protein